MCIMRGNSVQRILLIVLGILMASYYQAYAMYTSITHRQVEAMIAQYQQEHSSTFNFDAQWRQFELHYAILRKRKMDISILELLSTQARERGDYLGARDLDTWRYYYLIWFKNEFSHMRGVVFGKKI